LAAWLVGWLVALGQVVSAQAAVTLTRGPYLQSTTRDSTIIVWQTDLPGDSVVEYGVSDPSLLFGDSTPTTTHVIPLTGLIPGATYQYRIKTDGAVLHAATFATAPDPGGAFDFVMIGDSGVGSEAQAAVAAQMRALEPDFVLHLGDVIYPDGQAEGYDPWFFDPYAGVLDRAPVFPVLGNHDYISSRGQPYLEAFYLPANNPEQSERYYSFDWGNAHFTALDSNQRFEPDSDERRWLEADLAASDALWKFVFFHHALYTTGPHGHDGYVIPLRDTLAPLFEQYGVDFVFAGHDHTYERSTPRRDYAPASDGVVYIVSGGGGAGLYAVGASPFTAFSASVHHVVQVRIDDCFFSLRAIDVTGAALDQIALARCPRPPYLPIGVKP
jgi:predicted phosphodiesterase